MPERTDAATEAAIVAAYNETGSYADTARRFGLSRQTARKIVRRMLDTETGKRVTEAQKKSEEDIIAFLESRSEKACRIIEAYMDALLDPERLDRASPNQISTALGTVIDKFLLAKSLLKEDKSDAGGVIVLPEVKRDE